MPLVYRDVKGEKLTKEEGDANIRYLAENTTIVPDVPYYLKDDTGLTFVVNPKKYPVNNAMYQFPGAQEITVGAGGSSYDRFDAIRVNAAGVVSIQAGDEAVNIPEPNVDESLYYQAALILIPKDATSIDAVITTEIYNENTEWTATENTSAARIVLNSTNDPNRDTMSIEASSPAHLDAIDFTEGSSVAVADLGELLVKLKLKAAMPASAHIKVQWRNESGAASNVINLVNGVANLDNTNTADYQQIQIQKSDFTFSASTITYLRIEQKGSCLGWFLDDIKYQVGLLVKKPIEVLSTKELFTATAAQTEFVLNSTPDNVDVIADRIHQIETVDYTLTGHTVTMIDDQDSGTLIEVRKY